MDHQIGSALDTLHSLHTLLTQANPPLDVHTKLEGVLHSLVTSLGGVEREGSKVSGELSQGLLSHVSQPRGEGTNPRLYLKRQLESVVDGSGVWEKRSRLLGGVMAGLGKEEGGVVAPLPPPQGGLPPIITATGLSKVWGSVFGTGGSGSSSSTISSKASPALPPCDDELHARLLHPPTLEYLRHLGPGTGYGALREVLFKPYHGRPCTPLTRDDLTQFFRVFTAEEMEAGEAARAAERREEESAAQMERKRRIEEETKSLATSSSSFSSFSFSAPAAPAPSFTSALASSSSSSYPAPAPPPPSDDRDRVLGEAIAAGTAGELVLGWEREVFAALEAALPQGASNVEACRAAGEKEFAAQFKRSGCHALVGRIKAMRWGLGAGDNAFLYPTESWRTWGFTPEYGSVIEEGRMMDLVRIERRCALSANFVKLKRTLGSSVIELSSAAAAAAAAAAAGGGGAAPVPAPTLTEPYTPETLLTDIATMAFNALYYYRPKDCTPPFPSVVAGAAGCAKGEVGALTGLFPHPDTLPPGFSPVRNARGFPVGGELTYRAAWEVALACGAMWGEIKGAREFYHRLLLRASWTAALLPESLKWYQGGRLQEACAAGERERAVKGGYLALIDLSKAGAR